MTTSTEEKSGQAEAQPQGYELSEEEKKRLRIRWEARAKTQEYCRLHHVKPVGIPVPDHYADVLKRNADRLRATDRGCAVEEYAKSLGYSMEWNLG